MLPLVGEVVSLVADGADVTPRGEVALARAPAAYALRPRQMGGPYERRSVSLGRVSACIAVPRGSGT